MIQLEWAWVLAVLPLPLVLRRFLPAAPSAHHASLRVPHTDVLPVHPVEPGRRDRLSMQVTWKWLAWTLLVFAAARPQWVGDVGSFPVSGRDLLLAVDISGSMETRDFFVDDTPVDRLTATKQVAGDFIERRTGDRLGLILFGTRPYLQAPSTFDRETVRTLLDEAVVGLAGKETAIGSAIGLGVRRLRNRPEGDRVLILLTDGANTAGELDPLQAADVAAAEGVRVHTIGVGADEMLIRSLFGTRRVNPSTELDEETLTRIAERTGGRYFRARDSAQLEEIYRLLDEMEPVPEERSGLRPIRALYPLPLAASMLAAGVLIAVVVRAGR
jgi:Ca-activated chloride channel family protein